MREPWWCSICVCAWVYADVLYVYMHADVNVRNFLFEHKRHWIPNKNVRVDRAKNRMEAKRPNKTKKKNGKKTRKELWKEIVENDNGRRQRKRNKKYSLKFRFVGGRLLLALQVAFWFIHSSSRSLMTVCNFCKRKNPCSSYIPIKFYFAFFTFKSSSAICWRDANFTRFHCAVWPNNKWFSFLFFSHLAQYSDSFSLHIGVIRTIFFFACLAV